MDRAQLANPLTLPAQFWDHEPIRQALAQRHLGQVIRAYRHHPHHGSKPLRQETMGRWLGISQAQMSRVENGKPIVHLDRLVHWAQILQIPTHLLWFKLPGCVKTLDRLAETASESSKNLAVGLDSRQVPTVTVAAGVDDGGDTMRRRSLIIATALASLGITDHLGALLTPGNPPTRLGMDHLQPVLSAINSFERADAAIGGDELFHFAVALHQQVSRWERESVYDRNVREALQSTLGDLECWIGWFALDSERRPESRRFLSEAILRARINDDPQLEVRALQSMSMLVRAAHPQEALYCAEAAQRISAGWATPRLSTLLHLRAAHASAELKDALAFQREMAKALAAFEGGNHEDDPQYIWFVKPMEVAGLEAHSQLALGSARRAVRSFQGLMDDPDPDYRRNQVLYSVHLAKAKLHEGDLDAAGQLAIDAILAVTAVQSRRTRQLFATLRTDLGRQSARSTLARQFTVAYDEAVFA